MKEMKVPCEIYSRVVGYYRPVQNYNLGKKQEFKERSSYHKKLFFELGIESGGEDEKD